MIGSLFVTGAGGYLGKRFLALAPGENQRDRMVCLARQAQPAGGWFETVRGDLTDGASYARSLRGCETVVHMAAATGKNPAAEYFRVNRGGTAALLEQCRAAGVKRILHISTIAASFPAIERYYYAQSKLAAEKLIHDSGLAYCIVRPSMIFGKNAPVLEGLARLAGAPWIPLFGGGRNKVQPVYVDDLARALWLVLQTGRFQNEVFEIGGPDILTMRELLTEISLAMHGKPARMLPVPAAPVSAVLGLLEPLLLPWLPLTAGQMTSFTADGSTDPSKSLDAGPRKAVREMLQLAAAG